MLENSTQSRNDIENNFTINAFGVDFETSFDAIRLEFGSKYTNFKNNNDIKFYDRNNGNDVLNNNISNLFKYKGKIIRFLYKSFQTNKR